MELYPLIFEPILKEKVWGGQSLASFGKTLPEGISIGESWELADLPDSIEGGRSVIANGPLAGQTLHEVMAIHPELLGNAKLMNGCFPLLIMFLDDNDNISVQVHPTESYVSEHPTAHLKSEAWIVLDANEGSC
ncbi:MAG: type I phosphomannose isomerase catalytic subunit, partial [Planctomycetota bacterium]|nr:type I phosphomannose isomerase catalytic subunit [Planctomycetota bacterium]